MNEVSNRIPKPLMVATVKFSHPLRTTGRPNQVYRRQFRSAMMYGMHESSSVLPFLITLLIVNLKRKEKVIWYPVILRNYSCWCRKWDIANWVHPCCVKEQGSCIPCKRSKGKLSELAVFVFLHVKWRRWPFRKTRKLKRKTTQYSNWEAQALPHYLISERLLLRTLVREIDTPSANWECYSIEVYILGDSGKRSYHLTCRYM